MQRQRKDAWREGRSSSAAGARRRPARGDAAPRLVEVILEHVERGKRDAEQVPRAPEGARRRRLLRELAVGPEERRGRPLGVGLEARAEQVLANAVRVGVTPFIKARDVASGNAKLNLAFVAQLFNDRPGLDAVEEAVAKELADLDLDDATRWLTAK